MSERWKPITRRQFSIGALATGASFVAIRFLGDSTATAEAPIQGPTPEQIKQNEQETRLATESKKLEGLHTGLVIRLDDEQLAKIEKYENDGISYKDYLGLTNMVAAGHIATERTGRYVRITTAKAEPEDTQAGEVRPLFNDPKDLERQMLAHFIKQEGLTIEVSQQIDPRSFADITGVNSTINKSHEERVRIAAEQVEAWMGVVEIPKEGIKLEGSVVKAAIMDTRVPWRNTEADSKGLGTDGFVHSDFYSTEGGDTRFGSSLPKLHGSMVAGMVFAIQGNEKGTAGAIKKDNKLTVNEYPFEESADVYQIAWLIEEAARDGVQVLNLSANFATESPILAEAVRKFKAQGGFLVSSVSNSNSAEHPGYPAAYADLRVGSIREDGRIADWTPQSLIDILAVGEAFSIALEPGTKNEMIYYGYGNSLAAPQVFAAVIWLKSQYPQASNEAIAWHIKRTAKNGVLNFRQVREALFEYNPPVRTPTPNPIESPSATATQSPGERTATPVAPPPTETPTPGRPPVFRPFSGFLPLLRSR